MDNDAPSCNQEIKTTLAVIGDKYTALIIKLLEDQDRRFKDFEETIPEISSRTLTQRLNKLVDMKIIRKVQCKESPGRKSYALTASGRELHAVIQLMADWGRRHA